MKPIIKDGYIQCLAMFKPELISDDVWESMSLKEKDEKADWTVSRFPLDIFSYNKASFKASCTIRYDNGFSITVQATLEDLDKLLKPKNPIITSYMNTILEDIDGAINDDETAGGLQDIAYPLPMHPKFLEAVEALSEYGITYAYVSDEDKNDYIQLTW